MSNELCLSYNYLISRPGIELKNNNIESTQDDSIFIHHTVTTPSDPTSNNILNNLLLRLLPYQPLPRLHQHLPQQIQPPFPPIRTCIPRPKPNTPYPIPRTRLNQLPIPRCQQLLFKLLILRKLEIVSLQYKPISILLPLFIREIGDLSTQVSNIAGMQFPAFLDLESYRVVGAGEEEGFAVHHVSEEQRLESTSGAREGGTVGSTVLRLRKCIPRRQFSRRMMMATIVLGIHIRLPVSKSIPGCWSRLMLV